MKMFRRFPKAGAGVSRLQVRGRPAGWLTRPAGWLHKLVYLPSIFLVFPPSHTTPLGPALLCHAALARGAGASSGCLLVVAVLHALQQMSCASAREHERTARSTGGGALVCVNHLASPPPQHGQSC